MIANFSDNPEEDLNSLVNWLDQKSCVESVVLTCFSCIYTSPPQSEIDISFILKDETTDMVLDIIMSDTLKFGAYHENWDMRIVVEGVTSDGRPRRGEVSHKVRY